MYDAHSFMASSLTFAHKVKYIFPFCKKGYKEEWKTLGS